MLVVVNRSLRASLGRKATVMVSRFWGSNMKVSISETRCWGPGKTLTREGREGNVDDHASKGLILHKP